MSSIDRTPSGISSPATVTHTTSASAKGAIAREAVKAKVDTVTGNLVTPSLESILHAFRLDGNQDKELLIELVRAKRAEDQRIKAADLKYAEQYKAANLIMYEKMFMLQQQYQHQHAYATGYPSPTASLSESELAFGGGRRESSCGPSTGAAPSVAGYSPRVAPLSPLILESPMPMLAAAAASSSSHRKRSASETSDSTDVTTDSAKRAKHEMAMAALRARCELNKGTAAPQQQQHQQQQPVQTSHQRPTARRLSPAQLASIAPRKTSTSPPPQSAPQSTSFYAVPIASSACSSSSTGPASPAPSVTMSSTEDEQSAARRASSKKSTLASLLNGSNVTSRSFQAVTSDIRSSAIAA